MKKYAINMVNYEKMHVEQIDVFFSDTKEKAIDMFNQYIKNNSPSQGYELELCEFYEVAKVVRHFKP